MTNRRESARIRCKSEKAIANRAQERVLGIEDLPKVGSRIEVWFEVSGVGMWWGGKVVSLSLPEEFPVCTGAPPPGALVDVERESGVYVPGVVESGDAKDGDGASVMMIHIIQGGRKVAFSDVRSWRFSGSVQPKFEEEIIAEGRILYDAMPEKGYPCVGYDDGTFLLGRRIMCAGQQPTAWRRGKCSVGNVDGHDEGEEIELSEESSYSSAEDIRQAGEPDYKRVKTEDGAVRAQRTSNESQLETRVRVLEDAMSLLDAGKFNCSSSIVDNVGLVLLSMMRRGVEKMVEQAVRIPTGSSSRVFSTSMVDGAMMCGNLVTSPIQVPAALCSGIFRELLKGTIDLYGEGLYDVYPSLHSAMHGTGNEAITVVCSNFAVLSDMLGISLLQRSEMLVHTRNVSTTDGKEEEKENEESFWKQSSLQILGTALCEDDGGNSENGPVSMSIGSSMFCALRREQSAQCAFRRDRTIVQGQYVSKMEVESREGACPIHSEVRSGCVNGGRSRRNGVVKSFRVEWEPVGQRKRGRNGEGQWGCLRVYVPYVLIHGIDEPRRIAKLLSEEVVNRAVGAGRMEKLAEKYLL